MISNYRDVVTARKYSYRTRQSQRPALPSGRREKDLAQPEGTRGSSLRYGWARCSAALCLHRLNPQHEVHQRPSSSSSSCSSKRRGTCCTGSRGRTCSSPAARPPGRAACVPAAEGKGPGASWGQQLHNDSTEIGYNTLKSRFRRHKRALSGRPRLMYRLLVVPASPGFAASAGSSLCFRFIPVLSTQARDLNANGLQSRRVHEREFSSQGDKLQPSSATRVFGLARDPYGAAPSTEIPGTNADVCGTNKNPAADERSLTWGFFRSLSRHR